MKNSGMIWISQLTGANHSVPASATCVLRPPSDDLCTPTMRACSITTMRTHAARTTSTVCDRTVLGTGPGPRSGPCWAPRPVLLSGATCRWGGVGSPDAGEVGCGAGCRAVMVSPRVEHEDRRSPPAPAASPCGAVPHPYVRPILTLQTHPHPSGSRAHPARITQPDSPDPIRTPRRRSGSCRAAPACRGSATHGSSPSALRGTEHLRSPHWIARSRPAS